MTQEANPGLIYLEKVRLSFPHLAAPHASAPGATPKYSGDFIMDPTHPGFAAIYAAWQAKAVEKFGGQADAIIQFINADRKLRAYGYGEEAIDKNTMAPYAGYPGMVFVKANNAVQPALFDENGTQLMDARKFYGGCYVNVQVQPWIQDNQHGRGFRCELVGIQFHSDGEAFGVAPVDPNTLFGAVPGAPAPVAPGVGGPAPAAPAPAQYVPPAGGVSPAAPAPGVQAPGGYDPGMYPAPAATPVAPAGAPPALGVPGQPAPAAPAPVAPAPGVPGQPPGYPPQQ